MILYIHKRKGVVKRIVYAQLSQIEAQLEQAKIYIGVDVQLGDEVHIGIETQIFNRVVVNDEASIGRRVVLHNDVRLATGSYVKDGCIIGEGSDIMKDATVFDFCKIGKEVIIGRNVKIPKCSVISDNVDLTNPHSVNGSKDLVMYLGSGQLIIGCVQNTVSWWLSNYEEVGLSYGYTVEQIAEYHEYMVAANNLNG